MTTNIKDRFATLPKDDDSVYRSALITATAKQGGTVVEQVKANASVGVEHSQSTSNPHQTTLAQTVESLGTLATATDNDYLLIYSRSTLRWYKITLSDLMGTPREAKRLGSAIPALGVATALYTVPTGKNVENVSVTVCNTSSSEAEAVVAVVPTGASFGTTYYLLDAKVKAKTTVTIDGISLIAGDVIYVDSIDSAAVAYQAFGEVST